MWRAMLKGKRLCYLLSLVIYCHKRVRDQSNSSTAEFSPLFHPSTLETHLSFRIRSEQIKLVKIGWKQEIALSSLDSLISVHDLPCFLSCLINYFPFFLSDSLQNNTACYCDRCFIVMYPSCLLTHD